MTNFHSYDDNLLKLLISLQMSLGGPLQFLLTPWQTFPAMTKLPGLRFSVYTWCKNRDFLHKLSIQNKVFLFIFIISLKKTFYLMHVAFQFLCKVSCSYSVWKIEFPVHIFLVWKFGFFAYTQYKIGEFRLRRSIR